MDIQGRGWAAVRRNSVRSLDVVLESSTKVNAPTASPPSGFQALNLSETMLAALEKAGYLEPTQIQAGLIPQALEGVDLMGQARTGTGKTAAFVIPVLERLHHAKKGQGPQALILVPTRELAVQVREEVVKLAHGRKVHSVAVYGGKPIRGQIEKLSRGCEVVIGTPGRVLDHMGRGTLKLDDLQVVVLDEADRMLDIGFRPDIEKILRRAPRSRQTLLLSPPCRRQSNGWRSIYAQPRESQFFAHRHFGRNDRAVLLHG